MPSLSQLGIFDPVLSALRAALGKATPVDADAIPIADSAAAGQVKMLTFANLKAYLATWLSSATMTLTNKTLTSNTAINIRDAHLLVAALGDGSKGFYFGVPSGQPSSTVRTHTLPAVTTSLVGRTGSIPATATATGFAGQVEWDASHIYVCTATNTWVRAAVATW